MREEWKMSSNEPPFKRLKVENIDHNIDKYIEQINKSQNNLKPIVSDDVYREVSLIKVCTGHLKNVKDISKTISLLNECLPLENLKHLKRAKGKTILICPVEKTQCHSDIDIVSLLQAKQDNVVTELHDLFESFSTVKVPQYPPLLKIQAKDFNKIWPVSFHPDVYLEKLTGCDFFHKEELMKHRQHMCMAFEIARFYLKRDLANEFDEDTIKSINAAIVVDPKTNSVVAASIDRSMVHPMQHASMIAIDNVAKTQHGGVWASSIKEKEKEQSGIEYDLKSYLMQKFPKVTFGTSVVNEEKVEVPYLCTNYYVYMIKEPCIMCSMALIHARAKRVFFCFDNETMGGLKSRTKMHCVKSLNHHYEVFSGFL